jgi:hypothetical protein
VELFWLYDGLVSLVKESALERKGEAGHKNKGEKKGSVGTTVVSTSYCLSLDESEGA